MIIKNFRVKLISVIVICMFICACIPVYAKDESTQVECSPYRYDYISISRDIDTYVSNLETEVSNNMASTVYSDTLCVDYVPNMVNITKSMSLVTYSNLMNISLDEGVISIILGSNNESDVIYSYKNKQKTVFIDKSSILEQLKTSDDIKDTQLEKDIINVVGNDKSTGVASFTKEGLRLLIRDIKVIGSKDVKFIQRGYLNNTKQQMIVVGIGDNVIFLSLDNQNKIYDTIVI